MDAIIKFKLLPNGHICAGFISQDMATGQTLPSGSGATVAEALRQLIIEMAKQDGTK